MVLWVRYFFFFKQKTAYEMCISDWSSDVCSSDLSPVSARSLMELLGAAYAVHPAFGEAEVVEIGVDARPAFPDNLPRAWREGDTVFVNGLYRHGFLLAPAMEIGRAHV